MAKDVDLSSKEWLDIVFEGKNKEFGAYELRKTSTHRHTKALIIVLIALAVIGLGLFLSISGVFTPKEEDVNAGNEQELAQFDGEDDVEEEEEEEEMMEFEEPEPEEEQILEEDVANSIQNTILDVVEDDKVEREAKDREEILDTNAAVGNVDVSDGVDDLTKTLVTTEVVVEEKKPVEQEIIYNTANVQQQPTFPGGDAAMYKWLSEHIQYPAAAAEEGVSGRVVVEFVVSKTGAIENARVLRGRHPALDKEALRVVNAMPAWNPGRNNGQPVKVTYNLPVTFKLQQ